MNLAIVDLESTSLRSDTGFIFMGGIKPLGKPGKVIGIHNTGFGPDRHRIDKKCVDAIRTEMLKYDGWITWNGLMFDLPLLDDRLLINSLAPRTPRFARGLDMMWHASYGKSRMTSRRLDWVAKALNCPFQKTQLSMTLWKEAEANTIAALYTHKKMDGRMGRLGEEYTYIATHCLADLEVTEWLYNRFKHRIQTIGKK